MEKFFQNVVSFLNPDFFGIDPSSYSIAINLFVRLLGAIYIIAYVPFLFQIRGLFGKEGIRPMDVYLKTLQARLGKKRSYYLPTLFWINASDAALYGLIITGIVLGASLMFGITSPVILLLLYLIHLSLTSAGQEFLSFGWETYLLELTIIAAVMCATTPFNVFAWLALNILLMRFHVQAGVSKIFSHDKNWRNLTALSFHYLTQPLPNTQAWFFHKLPMWFHKFSAVIMYFVEIVVPLAIFSPPEVRLVVFVLLVGLQVSIWFTGNLSYLNHLTVVSCVILVHNKFLESFFSPLAFGEPSPIIWQFLISLLGIGLLALQIVSFVYTFFPKPLLQKILIMVEPFHLAYPHGIFAVMTTKRYEIIVEGSIDGIIWHEYEFPFKPGDLAKRPKRVAPYQPRLDWQAWFLPFRPFQWQWWFQEFLIKLLQGSKPVLGLLKRNPFPENPPIFVRALMYDYEFTTWKEKKETGNWWKRRLVGDFAPPMRLLTQEERKQTHL
jgi:lipase maturation factor 1